MNFKKIFTPFVIGFILIVPSFFFLLKPGLYWNMHDDMQLIRQMELEKCLTDGQIPCRWTPDLGYGYGYPLFNFYPPLPYLVGQVFRTVGFSFITAIKLTAATQIVVSYLGMYLLGSALFGSTGGFLSALFYSYAPYHAVNIYVRGAMNEAWASAFFPLILYFLYRQIHRPRWPYFLSLSLSLAGLFLSHNPMTIVFIPAVVFLSLFWSFPHLKTKLFNLILSGLLGIALAAFFLLPVASEAHLVQIESMFSNYYHYSVHFTSFRQLFISNYWGDGPSVWGQNDQMSFAIGYLQWIVPLLILPLIYFSFRKRFRQLHIFTIICILLGLFYAFLTHERSSFIWALLPWLQKVQFPWRLLNPSVLFFSLSVGILPSILKKILPKFNPKFIYIPLLTILLIINLPKFYPITSGPITDAQKFSGKAWSNQITSGIYDYLPKTAPIAPQSPPNGLVDEVIPANTTWAINNQKHGTDWIYLNLHLNNDTQVVFSQLDFPGFIVLDQNQPISHFADPKLGRIAVNLKAGDHQLFIKLQNTLIRSLANFISLAAWVGLLSYLILKLCRKPTSKT